MTTESRSSRFALRRAPRFFEQRAWHASRIGPPAKGGTSMNETAYLLEDAERAVVRAHEALADKASYLAERMTRLAARLGSEGASASINELGEVQGLGSDVDRLCALLHAARQTRDLVRRVADAAQEAR
jgi:hypothetical protein